MTHAVFVWSAYGAAAVILSTMVVASLLRVRQAERRLEGKGRRR